MLFDWVYNMPPKDLDGFALWAIIALVWLIGRSLYNIFLVKKSGWRFWTWVTCLIASTILLMWLSATGIYLRQQNMQLIGQTQNLRATITEQARLISSGNVAITPQAAPRNLEILGICEIHNVIPPCQISPSAVPNASTLFKFVVALFPNEPKEVQYEYAGRVNFFVRAADGTRGYFLDDVLYTIPDLNEVVDLEYATQYLGYTECSFIGNSLFDVPCLYVADGTTVSTTAAETYASVSRYFYGSEIYAGCVEDANRTIYLPTVDNFVAPNIVVGAVVVIPNKAGCND